MRLSILAGETAGDGPGDRHPFNRASWDANSSGGRVLYKHFSRRGRCTLGRIGKRRSIISLSMLVLLSFSSRGAQENLDIPFVSHNLAAVRVIAHRVMMLIAGRRWKKSLTDNTTDLICRRST